MVVHQDVVERGLHRRTWGRLRDLRVELVGNTAIVRGWTNSYYIKQLAIQALLEALGDSEWIPLVDIQVLSEPSLSLVS